VQSPQQERHTAHQVKQDDRPQRATSSALSVHRLIAHQNATRACNSESKGRQPSVDGQAESFLQRKNVTPGPSRHLTRCSGLVGIRGEADIARSSQMTGSGSFCSAKVGLREAVMTTPRSIAWSAFGNFSNKARPQPRSLR
jgi:hypothetical protein